MIFPRLIALAERAWHKSAWESVNDTKKRNAMELQEWSRFANIVAKKEFKELDALNITYRVPVPGAQ